MKQQKSFHQNSRCSRPKPGQYRMWLRARRRRQAKRSRQARPFNLPCQARRSDGRRNFSALSSASCLWLLVKSIASTKTRKSCSVTAANAGGIPGAR